MQRPLLHDADAPDGSPELHIRNHGLLFIAIFVFVCHIAAGLMYSIKYAGFSVSDSLYFISSTITTVGYGDYSFIRDNFSYIFGSCYILFGICSTAFISGVILRYTMESRDRSIQEMVAESICTQSTNRSSRTSMAKKALYSAMGGLLLKLFSVIGLCTIILSRLEGWSLLESVYWTIVSVSTVGYGDLCVVTVYGKLFATLFLPIGVFVTASVFSLFASVPFYFEKAGEEQSVLGRFGADLTVNSCEILSKCDDIRKMGLTSNDEFVTRNEYILWILMELGKIDLKDIKHCGQSFDLLDMSGEGKLTFASLNSMKNETEKPSIRRRNTTFEFPSEIKSQRASRPRSGSISKN